MNPFLRHISLLITLLSLCCPSGSEAEQEFYQTLKKNIVELFSENGIHDYYLLTHPISEENDGKYYYPEKVYYAEYNENDHWQFFCLFRAPAHFGNNLIIAASGQVSTTAYTVSRVEIFSRSGNEKDLILEDTDGDGRLDAFYSHEIDPLAELLLQIKTKNFKKRQKLCVRQNREWYVSFADEEDIYPADIETTAFSNMLLFEEINDFVNRYKPYCCSPLGTQSYLKLQVSG